MKKLICPIAVLILLSAGIFSFTKGKKENSNYSMPEPGFAVIELFTSEGCSSCPPADEIIADLQNQYKDRHVLALSFHVNYWDYLGWKDPFSAEDYTARQKYYAGIFNLNSIYTPQTVINGSEEFVGSDRSKLKKSIEEKLNADFINAINLKAIEHHSGKIEITSLIKTNSAAEQQLVLMLVQKTGTNNIRRGENSGKTLHHINIVRDILYLPVSQKEMQAAFGLPDGMPKENFFIAAFIQNKNKGNLTAVDSAQIN
jgi:hypothetical protein